MKTVGEVQELSHNNPNFSVFLPKLGGNVKQAAMSDASHYLKMLNDVGLYLWKGILRNDEALSDTPDEFKKFLKHNNIKITVDNIEIVTTINYRLYKDSRFFPKFEELCDQVGEDSKTVISKWLSII